MSEVNVVLGASGVEVGIAFGGKSHLYSHGLDTELGDFLKDVEHDFVGDDVQSVAVSDGKFLLSASSKLSRVWRPGKSRELVFTAKDGSQTSVKAELSKEEPSDEDSDEKVYEPLHKLSRSLSEMGEMRYILVTGGVLSGIGKGMTASSIGVLMRSLGFRVTAIKIDPYLNVDAGTMSPFEHGEVFVLDDGGETDLDLGNYERFLGVKLTSENNLTTGKVYKSVLEKERRGDYLGKTVQVVPHLTDEIIAWIDRVAHVPVDGTGRAAHVCIIELGGTVGDIESAPYIEALRQFQFKISKYCMARVHVSLVPVVGDSREEKTKPTQHSVRDLRAAGLHPDLIVCRSPKKLPDGTRRKIGQFCHMAPNHVISAHDITNLYHLPLLLHSQGMHHVLLHQLNLVPQQECDLSEFRAHALALDTDNPPVKIALIGKYTNLKDAYISVHKALTHAAMACRRKLELLYVESVDLEADENSAAFKEAWALVKAADGVVVPGGFGDRGVEGKIKALNYTRLNNVPTLGVCLGMQLMVVEYARSVVGWKDAHSEEFDAASRGGVARPAGQKATHVVMYMPEISRSHMGGTMRLGARCTLIADRSSLASRLYGGVSKVEERHRHRYEINPEMVGALESAGLRFVGQDDTHLRMEIVELAEDKHRFYFGTQFHPEFKSRPGHPSPPFEGLILASSRLALP